MKKLLNLIGIDSTIVFTIASRLVQAIGGMLSIFLVTKLLSVSEQGYYYTFASLVTVQLFFELGFSEIITQFVSHEFAHLKLENSHLVGEERHISRTASIFKLTLKWFTVMAFVLFAALIVIGSVFFTTYAGKSEQVVNWFMPWTLLCLATSITIFINPLLGVFEGLGLIKDVAVVKTYQIATQVSLIFLFFITDFGLYSQPLALVISLIWYPVWMFVTNKFSILRNLYEYKVHIWKVSYLKEIFPYQWKLAVSWISGFFIYQLFNPVLFATDGPIVAGQMGVTVALINGCSYLTLAWINTKIPLMSSLIAKKDYLALDAVFFKAFKQAVVLNVFILTTIIILKIVTENFFPGLNSRFLPLTPFILMCTSNFANQIIIALAVYLRCHKKEPLLVQSVVLAIATSLSTIVLGMYYGVTGITIGYATITIVIGLTWTIYTFHNKRILWHSNQTSQ